MKRLPFIILILAILFVTGSASAQAHYEVPVASVPSRTLLLSQFIFVNWETPAVTLMAQDMVAGSGEFSQLIETRGTVQGDGTWKFVVPTERFALATFSAVIVDPKTKNVSAICNVIPNAVAVIAGQKAAVAAGISLEGSEPWYLDLDKGISCEGSGCAALLAR